MSKRFIFQQQHGDRKKARLDVTRSDHNFPLSQNGPPKDDQSNWGDDNDDEILLLASQACEDAYNDVSSLPDYSLCMQPSSTSTQLSDSSTSKTDFTFKKPSNVPSTASTSLKDKLNRIASPLPGISSKVLPKSTDNVNLTDDLIFNDKIYKGQDSDQIYRQLLQLQEENYKLKSENGKLLEKCVTKEGEASILRTQLKTCQMAVDNARIDKIKAQEKVQMEWTEKLTAANGQMHDLRTQLDFKNLEIISIKERCKMLESNKIKLTQVNVTHNENNISHRNNTITNDHTVTRKVKMATSSVQTEDKSHFLKLNKSYRSEPSQLTGLLPQILESSSDQHSLLEYNEKLQKHTDLSQNKCRIYSTFHRVPSTPVCKELRNKICMNDLYKDLTGLAAGGKDFRGLDRVLSTIQSVLSEVIDQLELISKKSSTAFQKEMDERYIEATAVFLVVGEKCLLSGRTLYNEEQAILARRMIAVLCVVLNCTKTVGFQSYGSKLIKILEQIHRICCLLDSTSCAIVYSGLLLSIANLMLQLNQKYLSKTIEIIKNVIISRPMPFVSCQLLRVLRNLSLEKEFLIQFCSGTSAGNLRLDYDQGVLLYRKDTCYLQILLKQIEVALKCIAKHDLTPEAVDTTGHLIAIYSNINCKTVVSQDSLQSCDCILILLQIIVYGLSICAGMLNNMKNKAIPNESNLLSICRSGVKVIYQCVLRDAEFSSQLGYNEGYLMDFCECVKNFENNEVYVNMLSEIAATFQSSPEDVASLHHQPWVHSFDSFNLTD